MNVNTTEPANDGHLESAACGNCGEPLAGPFWYQCGQHAHESARSLSALWHNAWSDLTQGDGRLSRTMRLLMLRPGQLTVEYFHDRRAAFWPPVRLYLAVSIVFFAFSWLVPSGPGG